jgi:hypothetical protein
LRQPNVNVALTHWLRDPVDMADLVAVVGWDDNAVLLA